MYTKNTCIVLIFLFVGNIYFTNAFNNKCYDNDNKPRKCYPEFINIAHDIRVKATNTCGTPPTEYCRQVSSYSENLFSRSTVCDICDSQEANKAHPIDHLIDKTAQLTWWQSETMNEGIQYPNSVNLTLNLGKAYEITYVQIKFFSPRPESFAIYKKTNESSEWTPYQYYSASCELTYGLPFRGIQIKRGNEAIALCTDEFSDITPLTGASVAFSTLEGRPSAYSFDTSEELKDWVTATDIQIVLNRLNTFGDEIFSKSEVLKSYYYAISDVSIGGRCKCNGHAERCVYKTGENFEEKLTCDCQHNTDGTDCERCLPFFNNIPWAPATFTNAHECKPCNCSGKSNKCFFDRELYEQTGHGGHCVECEENTDGVHCEHCREGFYRLDDQSTCVDCNCNPFGSESLQCDPEGKCRCKHGVTGLKCDQCALNYFNLGENGCQPCNCSVVGSFDNPPRCDSFDGRCRCKANVEGQKCDICKPGYFNLDEKNSLGCIQCFCFGHSSECTSSNKYFHSQIVSNFENDNDGWNIIDSSNNILEAQHDIMLKAIRASKEVGETWFNAPQRFLGDQRASYGQDVVFELEYNAEDARFNKRDFIIENANIGLKVQKQLSIDLLNTNIKTFSINLLETNNWHPSLSSYDFNRLLSNITSLLLKASLGRSDNTYIKNFYLASAKAYENVDENLKRANWVEKCLCPQGYAGEYCESCGSGYRRETVNGNSFLKCVPCICNNHSESCSEKTGVCNCMHQTTGNNCERCKDGYYGNPLNGSPHDCKKCQCPNDGSCAEVFNYQTNSVDVVCLNCPEGTQGNMCEICEDGYFLDPLTNTCQKCFCNDNIDENAIGNCDTSSGICLRCVFNTTGDKCEKCLPDHWGDALTDLKCHACECDLDGTSDENLKCNPVTGQCECKRNVVGRHCNQCAESYWNITSGAGCSPCKCDPLGSVDQSCNVETGQCICKPGVTGLKCNECLDNYYHFSDEGCKPCLCDSLGSKSMQCDDFGKCICKKNVVGEKCDKCAQNFYSFAEQCLKCDECYNLVEKKTLYAQEKAVLVKTEIENPSKEVEILIQKTEMNEKLQNLKASITDLQNKILELSPQKDFPFNYDQFFIESLGDLSICSNLIKSFDQDLDSKKDNLELLDSLQSLVGNTELELSAVQLIIEELEAQVKKTGLNGTLNNPLKDSAKSLRISIEKEEQNINALGKNIHHGINEMKNFLLKLKQKQTSSKNQIKINNQNSANVSEVVSDSYSLQEILKKDTEIIVKNVDALTEVKQNSPDNSAQLSEFEQFLEKITHTAKYLQDDIENITKRVNQLSTKEIVNSTRFAEASWELAKIKGKEFASLNEIAKKSKITADKSVQMISAFYENITTVLDTLRNFDSLVNQSEKRAVEAKLNEQETSRSIQYISLLSKDIMMNFEKLFEEMRILETENHHFKNKIERITQEFESLKNESGHRIKLSQNTEALNKKFESILLITDNIKMLQQNQPVNIEDYHQRAEELISRSKTLSNTINDAIIITSELQASKFENIRISQLELTRLSENLESVEITSIEDFNNEIQNLDITNQKILRKIENLENKIPTLERDIESLSNINDKIKSNECYSNRHLTADLEEIRYKR